MDITYEPQCRHQECLMYGFDCGEGVEYEQGAKVNNYEKGAINDVIRTNQYESENDETTHVAFHASKRIEDSILLADSFVKKELDALCNNCQENEPFVKEEKFTSNSCKEGTDTNWNLSPEVINHAESPVKEEPYKECTDCDNSLVDWKLSAFKDDKINILRHPELDFHPKVGKGLVHDMNMGITLGETNNNKPVNALAIENRRHPEYLDHELSSASKRNKISAISIQNKAPGRHTKDHDIPAFKSITKQWHGMPTKWSSFTCTGKHAATENERKNDCDVEATSLSNSKEDLVSSHASVSCKLMSLERKILLGGTAYIARRNSDINSSIILLPEGQSSNHIQKQIDIHTDISLGEPYPNENIDAAQTDCDTDVPHGKPCPDQRFDDIDSVLERLYPEQQRIDNLQMNTNNLLEEPFRHHQTVHIEEALEGAAQDSGEIESDTDTYLTNAETNMNLAKKRVVRNDYCLMDANFHVDTENGEEKLSRHETEDYVSARNNSPENTDISLGIYHCDNIPKQLDIKLAPDVGQYPSAANSNSEDSIALEGGDTLRIECYGCLDTEEIAENEGQIINSNDILDTADKTENDEGKLPSNEAELKQDECLVNDVENFSVRPTDSCNQYKVEEEEDEHLSIDFTGCLDPMDENDSVEDESQVIDSDEIDLEDGQCTGDETDLEEGECHSICSQISAFDFVMSDEDQTKAALGKYSRQKRQLQRNKNG